MKVTQTPPQSLTPLQISRSNSSSSTDSTDSTGTYVYIPTPNINRTTQTSSTNTKIYSPHQPIKVLTSSAPPVENTFVTPVNAPLIKD